VLARAGNPPLRLPLGGDAVAAIEAKNAAVGIRACPLARPIAVDRLRRSARCLKVKARTSTASGPAAPPRGDTARTSRRASAHRGRVCCREGYRRAGRGGHDGEPGVWGKGTSDDSPGRGSSLSHVMKPQIGIWFPARGWTLPLGTPRPRLEIESRGWEHGGSPMEMSLCRSATRLSATPRANYLRHSGRYVKRPRSTPGRLIFLPPSYLKPRHSRGSASRSSIMTRINIRALLIDKSQL
jgi:hypothetical protein